MTDRNANDSLRDRLVALTRDLVIIPSTALRPEDRERCYQFVRNHIDGVEGTEIREYRREGFPSLVALPAGCTEPDVLLCAHLDVVGLPDAASYRTHVAGGRIYGPGAADMKGPLTVLLELFHEFHNRHPGVSLGLAVTSDEEVGGHHGIGYLFGEVGLRCGLAVIPDGGSPHEVTVEEKGILHLKLTALGRSGHAARPWLAGNPLEKLTGAVARLRRHFDALATDDEDHWYPTCAATSLWVDNETVNRIPSRAAAVLDVRFPPPHTMASMLDTVRELLGSGVGLEVLVGDEPTHLAPDPAYIELVQDMTGKPVRQVRESGGSDARFVCRHGVPVLMARPEVGNLHGEDEWIDVASMVAFYRVCERYLERRLTGGVAPPRR